ncbi:hypothetical protein D3C72_742070 [compost metagenome]
MAEAFTISLTRHKQTLDSIRKSHIRCGCEEPDVLHSDVVRRLRAELKVLSPRAG